MSADDEPARRRSGSTAPGVSYFEVHCGEEDGEPFSFSLLVEGVSRDTFRRFCDLVVEESLRRPKAGAKP